MWSFHLIVPIRSMASKDEEVLSWMPCFFFFLQPLESKFHGIIVLFYALCTFGESDF